MQTLIQHGWVLWRATVLQVRETARVKTALVISVIQPVVFLTVASQRGSSADPRRTTEIALGCVMLALWSSTVWGAGTLLRREATQGTLAALLVRPASLLAILMGKTLGIAATGLVRALAAVAIAVPVLGLRVDVPDPAAAAVIAVAALVSAAAMGLLLCCVVFLSRAGLRIIEALGYPVFVLGGLVIPLDMLPVGLRRPAQVITLHHVTGMVHDAAYGGMPTLVHLAGFALLTALYLAGGVWAFDVVLRRGRARGTLELA
ncbi:ABC transporter permease (plasmid) [Embleya sp. NBC_00888]|uniref:ABC transporter permease n=1 Tax=Embleya sp. NBC_00888 TaxID=2975960 RepID=UPI002F91A695|nr:ABC transporter permease [Embleya sp. NBC_00888]